MNREIKFRGWNTITKTMLDLKAITPLAKDSKLECDGLFLPFTKEIVLMQFTGLKDKNGKEIYEGDIVNLKHGTGATMRENLIITWGKYGFYAKEHWSKQSGFSLDTTFVEVIGNIYEQPEMAGIS